VAVDVCQAAWDGDPVVIAALAALALTSVPCWHASKRIHPCRTHVAALRDPAAAAERLLRRRVVRMARIAYLERKQAMLAEFLARAETEQPVLRDDRRLVFGPISIGPAAVTRDFLGSPVLRVRVRNDGGAVFALITARLRSATHATVEATAAVRLLAKEETREVQIEFPQDFAPLSIDWEVTQL
jgi:hypothetical protein